MIFVGLSFITTVVPVWLNSVLKSPKLTTDCDGCRPELMIRPSSGGKRTGVTRWEDSRDRTILHWSWLLPSRTSSKQQKPTQQTPPVSLLLIHNHNLPGCLKLGNYISLEHGRGRGIFIDCNYFAHRKTLILSVLRPGLLRIRAGRERQSDRGILLMVQTRLTWLGKVSLANFGDKVMSQRHQIIPRYIISVMIFHFLYYCIIDDL